MGDHEITIVLADDHAVVRAGLRLLLDAEPDMRVVAEAADVPGAVRRTVQHQPVVLVLDLNMPGSGGSSLEALPTIRSAAPDTGIAILTMQEDPAFARRALSTGASAYVLKEAADTELVQAVRRTASGGTYLHPRLGASLATAPSPSRADETLTERELEVLHLIALGHTNAEIGARLYRSTRTVESHRAHIQQKLGLTTRAELVRYALDRGMLVG